MHHEGINPRRACAARVTVSVRLSTLVLALQAGYEAANEWHQRVLNDEKIDIMWRFSRNDCVPEIWRQLIAGACATPRWLYIPSTAFCQF